MTIFSTFAGAGLVNSKDFSVESANQKITVCKGSVFTDPIVISDNSKDKTNLEIVASPWANVVPKTITVDKKGIVYNLIKPPQDTKPGIYEISTLFMKGSFGVELKQIVEVVDCPFDVSIEQNSFGNCPCLPTVYDFLIQNRGDSSETFDLFVNLPSDQYELSESPLVLKAKESRHIFVSVKMPCDEKGQYGLSFTTQARSSGKQIVTPFYLVTKDGCYDYDFIMNDSFEFCIGDDAKVPFTIKNNGALNQTFRLELISDSGALIGDEYTILAGSGIASIIKIDTTQTTDFNGTLRLASMTESEDKSFDVKVSDCVAESKLKLNIFIGIIIFFVILIAIILFLLFRVTNGERSEEKSEGCFKKHKWFWLLLLLLLLIILFLVFKFGAIGIVLLIWHFILLYKLYFLLGFIAMIILLLYFWLVPSKRDLRFMFFLIVIGSIIFLILSLCFFTGFCSRLGLGHSIEANEKTDDAVILNRNATTYIWNKNSVEVIDLSKFIVNSDNDDIEIQTTQIDNITVEIDGMNVLLKPAKDWSGTRVINFIARDGRGSSAISPDITLIVLNKESSKYDSFLEFVVLYGNFILVGFFLAVFIVILFILMTYTRKPKRVIIQKKTKN